MNKVYEKDGSFYLPNGEKVDEIEIIRGKTYYRKDVVIYDENGQIHCGVGSGLMDDDELKEFEEMKKRGKALLNKYL